MHSGEGGATDGAVGLLEEECLTGRAGERRECAGAGRGALAEERADDGAVELREGTRLAGERGAQGVSRRRTRESERRGRRCARERALVERLRRRGRPVRVHGRGERACGERVGAFDGAGRGGGRAAEARAGTGQCGERTVVVRPAEVMALVHVLDLVDVLALVAVAVMCKCAGGDRECDRGCANGHECLHRELPFIGYTPWLPGAHAPMRKTFVKWLGTPGREPHGPPERAVHAR